MTPLERRLLRLRNFNAWVRGLDPKLNEEARDTANLETFEIAASQAALENDLQLESIVLRRTRPVLAIKENVTQLVFQDEQDSEIWKERIGRAQGALDVAIRAVGRINLSGGDLEWVGTGWLVRDNVIVTNRHVARMFAIRKGDGFTFKMAESGPVNAAVDFLQEIDNPNTLSFKLLKPLHIENADGLDVAFFEVELTGGNPKLAQPLPVAVKSAKTQSAAVIGYPAYDSRIPEPDLMEQIYGNIYNKKRLAPGAVTLTEENRILHNCTTLGGNSGSAVVDFESGQALGLHFSGTFLTANYAVPANLVQDLLDKARHERLVRREARRTPAPAKLQNQRANAAPARRINASNSITIPLMIIISLGEIASDRPLLPTAPVNEIGDEIEGEEAAAADYRDRNGYNPGFLGEDAHVALPKVTRAEKDVLTFGWEGKTESVLK